MRVLVVDDDGDIRAIVRRILERESIEVVLAADADDALRAAAQPIDVALLDIGLPGVSGLELLARLRERQPDLPVIMLTGAGAEADRVLGLMSGADDYVVKPFSGRELVARVLAAGRRRGPMPTATLEVGGLRIEVAGRQVTVDGQPVELTRREFDLLRHLAAHAGRTFSRDELLRAVWASSAEWQTEATVTEHVRRLRMKIESNPSVPARLVTVRGSGYRLEPNEPAPASQPALTVTAAELISDPTVVVVAGVIVHTNEAALRLLGADGAAHVVDREIVEFVAPESVEAARARARAVLEGRWLRPEVMTMLRRDGEPVLVEVASFPVLWEGARASQVTLWDLSSDRSRLRELATGVQTEVADAVIIADARLRILSFNPAAEQLYGWREAEVIGRRMADVLPPAGADATAGDLESEVDSHGRWHGELVQPRRDGTSVVVRSSADVLHDSTGERIGVVAVNRPVAAAPRPGSPDGPTPAELRSLDDEIRLGLERSEFVVHYQPVVRLDTGGWDGAEALVRWQHPRRGLLAPVSFIDRAERSGAIRDLGLFVIDEACKQWRTWDEAGLSLHMAVNLSARQIAEPGLADRIERSMVNAVMPKGALWLEVTETSLVEDLDQATRVLARLSDFGACVSIDDFGTGWASLTYLREFPVHSLKIDQTFVAGLGTSRSDAAIVSSIISLGRELGLTVVAEGIETAEQLHALRTLGCRLGQGFLFSRPLPADELLASRR